MTGLFSPPRKRSVEIAGHKTSVTLEPIFWDALNAAARKHGVPLNALVARIDAARLIGDEPPGLASAIRVWLLAEASGDAGPTPDAYTGQ